MKEMKKGKWRQSVWYAFRYHLLGTVVVLALLGHLPIGWLGQLTAEETEVGIIYLVPCMKCAGNSAWLETSLDRALELARENGVDKAEILRITPGKLIFLPCKIITFRPINEK